MRRDYRWIEAAISHITAQLSATGAGPQADTLQAALNLDWTTAAKIRFLHGKQFQMKLWEALLRIPAGRLASYGDVAVAVGGYRWGAPRKQAIIGWEAARSDLAGTLAR